VNQEEDQPAANVRYPPPEGITSPRGVRERLVFTTVGVILMVTTMSLFNKALEHGGLTWDVFRQVPQAFLLRAPLAYTLQFFVAQRFAGEMTSRYLTNNRIEYYAIRTGFTVMVMCPVMSFWSNAIYLGFTADFVPVWLTRMVLNWIFAFSVQIFLIGPLNRALFRALVRRS